jgi:hypothetical protein
VSVVTRPLARIIYSKVRETLDEAIRTAIIIIGGALLATLLRFGLTLISSRLRERNMNVGKRLRSIFMDPKKRRAQRLVAGLSLQLSKLYEDAVRDATLQLNSNLLVIHGTGPDLAVDLSAEGVDKLMDNLPLSIASLLKTEGAEVRKQALEFLKTFESFGKIEDLWIHPIVREMMIKLLESKDGKSQEQDQME